MSSLHQLKEENLDLEFSVDRMVQRRDHLLAVRARLLALSSLTVATPTNSNSQTGIYESFASYGFKFFKFQIKNIYDAMCNMLSHFYFLLQKEAEVLHHPELDQITPPRSGKDTQQQ